MTGKIFERTSGIATQEFTLDYTPDNTYYLSSVAYGNWETMEFDTEEELNSWLKNIWDFTDDEVKELKNDMYVKGE